MIAPRQIAAGALLGLVAAGVIDATACRPPAILVPLEDAGPCGYLGETCTGGGCCVDGMRCAPGGGCEPDDPEPKYLGAQRARDAARD